MKLIEILVCLFLFLYIFECQAEFNSGKTDTLNVEDSISADLKFTVQEIIYIAPKSSSVNLAWSIESYTFDEAFKWNKETKITYGLLCLPMEAHGDTFKINLSVPDGAKIQYYFWTTKNKQGDYYDFWDDQSSGEKIVTNTIPIIKNAIYSKAESKKELKVISYGWIILILLVLICSILFWARKKWIPNKPTTSKSENLFFIGLSMAFFHAIARCEIINVNLLNIIYSPSIIVKIIRGSYSDLIFIASIVLVFVAIVRFLKNFKLSNIIYGIFIFIALFSTLVAFTNITTVIYLGKPFTYQWLYYSDFLSSNEAKTAMQENLSVLIILNLISYCVSLFVLSSVLRNVYLLISVHSKVKKIALSVMVLGFITLLSLSFKSSVNWTKGQSENAITSMACSIVAPNSNSSFYAADIPHEIAQFNPSQGFKLDSSVVSFNKNEIKNVLFIVLESAGARYFDDYGGKFQLSPNLSKYAKHSLIFEQMYAHAPSTNLTLVSLLGSMYPYLSYQSITQEAPDVDIPTLSSVLKNEGFRTSFFTSADLRFQNCREFLTHRGFDVVEDFSEIKCSEEFKLESNEYVEGNGIDDICLSDRLFSWIDEDSTQNFFSMLWTVQGHYPYFFAGQEKDFGVSDYNFNRYLNCLKHNDELVGRIMKSLEERGLAATTLVVVVGDHGEAFGQHGQYGHGTAIYEENVKVPLYFINSTLFNGERKFDIAGMKDIASTALSIIDVDIPKNWQGLNLLDTYSDEVFYFAPWSDYLFGYRKANMKYIFNETRNTAEVFDLNKDPLEKTNLFDSINKEQLQNARNRVGAWVQYQDKYVKELLKK